MNIRNLVIIVLVTLFLPVFANAKEDAGNDWAKNLVHRSSDGAYEAIADYPAFDDYRLICIKGPDNQIFLGWGDVVHNRITVGALFDYLGRDLSEVYRPVCGSMKSSPTVTKDKIPLPSLSSNPKAVPIYKEREAIQPKPDLAEPELERESEQWVSKGRGSQTRNDLYRLSVTAAGYDIHPAEGGETLYVYSNPRCPYCKRLWDALEEIDLTGIRLVKIPVGASQTSLKMSSEELADQKQYDYPQAALLVADNTKRLLEFSKISPSEGVTGRLSTPTLIWRDAIGEIRIAYGNPNKDKLDALLASIRGGR